MRFNPRLTTVFAIGLAVIAGCAQPPAGPTFQANELAKSKLANTTWTGPAGNVSLTFDSNAKLVGLTIKNPKTEVTNLSFTSSPFTTTVTLPQHSPVYAGQTFTVTMTPTKTELYSDNTFLIQFQATVAEVPEVDHFTLTVTGSLAQVNNQNRITAMNIELSATAVVLKTEIVVPIYSVSLDNL